MMAGIAHNEGELSRACAHVLHGERNNRPGMCSCVAEEGAIRQTGARNGTTAGTTVGVLEIFHAGAWGTVCLPNDSTDEGESITFPRV